MENTSKSRASEKDVNELNNAVKYLKSQGIIKRDADISTKMDYSKGTVSAYLSGKTQPSESFIEKFEKVFKLKLKDHQATVIDGPQKLNSTTLSTDDLKVSVQDYINDLKANLEFQREMIRTNLSQLSSTQHLLLAQVKAGLQWEAKVAAKGNKEKEEQILAEINKLVAEQMVGEFQTDSNAVSGR
jgi:transcriptional regulator with XRE-family HTH domain